MKNLKESYNGIGSVQPYSIYGTIESSLSMEDENGTPSIKPVYTSIDLTSDAAVDILPTVAELSLSNALASGVNLQQVNTMIIENNPTIGEAYGEKLAEQVINANNIE